MTRLQKIAIWITAGVEAATFVMLAHFAILLAALYGGFQ